MPVYDGDDAKYLPAAVESILSQTFKDFELVIVMDGVKRRDLAEIIYAYARNNDNIIVDNLAVNKGIVYALNRSIELSSGKYLIRMDADDISATNRIQKLVDYLDAHGDIYFVGSFLYEINDAGEITSKCDYPTEWKKILKFLPWRVAWGHPTVAFRREFFEIIGGYRDKYYHNEDYDLWFRAVIKDLRGANIPEYLYKMRVNSGFYGRRRGLKLALSEFKVRKDFIRHKYFPYYSMPAPFVIFVVRMLPQRMIKSIYKIFMRGSTA